MEIENPRQIERKDTSLRVDLISSIARKRLGSTALVRNKKWGESDVDVARQFLVEVAPYGHPKINPSYWDHLLLASIYGRKLALQVGINIDPHEAEVLGFLNDIGRLAIANRYGRNDVAAHVIWSRVGLRREVGEKLVPLARILGRGNPIEGIDDMTEGQRVNDVSDNLGKKRADGSLFTIQDVINYDPTQVYYGQMWPSERLATKALTRGGRAQLANKLFLEEVDWLKRDFGIEFSSLRSDVENVYNEEENQRWLLSVLNAQETLNPRIDKELGRPAVKNVVFDFGGVLIKNSDNDLANSMSAKLGCSPEEILKTIGDLSDEGMPGSINEEEFLRRFFDSLNRVMPSTVEEARNYFVYPENYQPMEGMQNLVHEIKVWDNVQVYVLSDCIASVAGVNLEQLRKLYPEFPEENIFFSCKIGASKRGNQAFAFKKFLEMTKLDPRSCLFIDDKETYSTAARSLYNMRDFTFRGNPYSDTTASQRLQEELKIAGII